MGGSAATDLVDVVAGSLGGGEYLCAVIATLDLEHCLHAGLTNMQVDTFAGMLYLDEVGAAVGEDGQQPCQGPGSIADASEQYESSAHACFVAPDEARQYSEIYVAPAVSVKVELSTDLTFSTPADDITIGPVTDAGPIAPSGASYIVTNSVGFDTIVLTIPQGAAPKKFARVKAVQP